MDPILAEHVEITASAYAPPLAARIRAFAATLSPTQVAVLLALIEAVDNEAAAALLPRPLSDDPRAQVAQEIALAQLDAAAAQLGRVKAAVRDGDATQAELRAARARLEQAALAYAAAHGWQSPAGGPR
jgi:hypothetical protein